MKILVLNGSTRRRKQIRGEACTGSRVGAQMRVKRLLSVLLVCLLLSGCGAQAGKTTIAEPSDGSGSIESNAGDDTVMESGNQILLTVNGQTLTATLAENSSAQELKDLLGSGNVQVTLTVNTES